MFISRRGPSGYWLMDADGSNIRPVPEPADGGGRKKPYWSNSDPDRVLTFRSDEQSTTVISMNVHDGSVEEVVSLPEGTLAMEPPHPDDRHFLFHRDREESGSGRGRSGCAHEAVADAPPPLRPPTARSSSTATTTPGRRISGAGPPGCAPRE